MTDSNRNDRRRFLAGLGSSVLALPMLEAFLPRGANAQAMRPPKRLLIIYNQDGRLIGDGLMQGGQRNDWWSPAAAGALPLSAPPSQMLAPLLAVRNEVVTLDGIDNRVRHLYSDSDNHQPAQKALLTCRKPAGSSSGVPTAPSFDYVMGQRLRAAGSTAPASMVMFGTAADYAWRANNLRVFFGANGTPPWLIDPDPATAIAELFGAPSAAAGRLTGLTLRQRLAAEKKSVLDGVLDNFGTLRRRVNASDRARLDAHADFIRSIEGGLGGGPGGGTATAGGSAGEMAGGSAGGGMAGGMAGGRAGGQGGGGVGGGTAGGRGGGQAGGSGGGRMGGGSAGGGSAAGGSAGGGSAGGGSAGGGAAGGGSAGGGAGPSTCQRPIEGNVPSNTNASGATYLNGERDAQMMPAIVENIVQAFACDVTRVMSLMFWKDDSHLFPTQFPAGVNPFVANSWHTMIHETPRIYDDMASQQKAQNLAASYRHYTNTFTSLVQRLAATIEPDGSRMLDNTLILWVSEMGYGSVHATYNIPVVMAGLRSAFPLGQGRHVVENRRSMGDLLSHVMRLFGGTDTTFGETGTLGSNGSVYAPGAGWAGAIAAGTPLHSGPLNL